MPLWIPEQMSAFAFHAISLERRGWATSGRRRMRGLGRERTVSFWTGKTDNRTLVVEGRPGTAVEPCGGADAQVVPGLGRRRKRG